MKLALPKIGSSSSRKSKQPQPTWREMLQLRPIRNPNLEWTEEEGRVVLVVRHGVQKNWKARLFGLLVPLPEDRRIVLDAIGTDVWQMTDGENTLGRIAGKLASKYKLPQREAELSLQQYFKDLARRGYVGFLDQGAVNPQQAEAQAVEGRSGKARKMEDGQAENDKLTVES